MGRRVLLRRRLPLSQGQEGNARALRKMTKVCEEHRTWYAAMVCNGSTCLHGVIVFGRMGGDHLIIHCIRWPYAGAGVAQ